MPTSCLAEYRRSDLDASATLSSPHKRPPAFTGNTVAPTTPPSCQTYADQVAYVLNFFQVLDLRENLLSGVLHPTLFDNLTSLLKCKICYSLVI
uniref:Uncharacterized protein n=1 Tax=Zea mays TaxID=4577 RepID=B4FH12_MAIZE|nr:unknown [Zea mays]